MNHSSCTKSRTRSLPEREESFSKAHKCLLTCPLPFVRLCISRSTSRKKATLKEDHQQRLCFLPVFYSVFSYQPLAQRWSRLPPAMDLVHPPPMQAGVRGALADPIVLPGASPLHIALWGEPRTLPGVSWGGAKSLAGRVVGLINGLLFGSGFLSS